MNIGGLLSHEMLDMIRRGRQHYHLLRPKVEAEHRGKFIAISVLTGAYVILERSKDSPKFDHDLPEGDYVFTAPIGDARMT